MKAKTIFAGGAVALAAFVAGALAVVPVAAQYLPENGTVLEGSPSPSETTGTPDPTDTPAVAPEPSATPSVAAAVPSDVSASPAPYVPKVQVSRTPQPKPSAQRATTREVAVTQDAPVAEPTSDLPTPTQESGGILRAPVPTPIQPTVDPQDPDNGAGLPQ